MLQGVEGESTVDWDEQARSFADAAHHAAMRGGVEDAWRAWISAGECWSRADRPANAERSYRRAQHLTEIGGSAYLLTTVRLAGILAQLGEPEFAEEMLETLVADQPLCASSPQVLDTRIALLVSLGRKEAARVLFQVLQESAEPAAGLASRYRRAQLDMLDGRLGRASGTWKRMLGSLDRDATTRAGLGGVYSGLAEVSLLRGQERDAMDLFDKAAGCHRRAGRQSLAYGAVAGRVRAMVALGVQPLPTLLDGAIEFAKERRLRPLQIGLVTSAALAVREVNPGRADELLAGAIELAMNIGLPLGVGRAVYHRAVYLPASDAQRLDQLDMAALALVSHAPLAAKVGLARARLLARGAPAKARLVARACIPQLERMGMTRELMVARALLRQLG
ncbi:MAG: tetratricopeptide (TPR) repeat protein [Kiritimatiellia bacterium]|jgi:tetratricopeptide (TPR) repeat protein